MPVMPYWLFSSIPAFLLLVFQPHISRITPSTVIYGRAGCITFHSQQCGHAACIHFHCQQYERTGWIPVYHWQYGCAGCMYFFHLCKVFKMPDSLPSGQSCTRWKCHCRNQSNTEKRWPNPVPEFDTGFQNAYADDICLDADAQLWFLIYFRHEK